LLNSLHRAVRTSFGVGNHAAVRLPRTDYELKGETSEHASLQLCGRTDVEDNHITVTTVVVRRGRSAQSRWNRTEYDLGLMPITRCRGPVPKDEYTLVDILDSKLEIIRQPALPYRDK
jgi:hypothetical protein